jgi:hypothetical protein
MNLFNDSLYVQLRVGQASDVQEEVQSAQGTNALQYLLGLFTTDKTEDKPAQETGWCNRFLH